jgi:hypothetical protein
MISGIIGGTAVITGAPVIRKDVTGVITDNIRAGISPVERAQIIRQAFTTGPVMKTLMFLKI